MEYINIVFPKLNRKYNNNIYVKCIEYSEDFRKRAILLCYPKSGKQTQQISMIVALNQGKLKAPYKPL